MGWCAARLTVAELKANGAQANKWSISPVRKKNVREKWMDAEQRDDQQWNSLVAATNSARHQTHFVSILRPKLNNSAKTENAIDCNWIQNDVIILFLLSTPFVSLVFISIHIFFARVLALVIRAMIRFILWFCFRLQFTIYSAQTLHCVLSITIIFRFICWIFFASAFAFRTVDFLLSFTAACVSWAVLCMQRQDFQFYDRIERAILLTASFVIVIRCTWKQMEHTVWPKW